MNNVGVKDIVWSLLNTVCAYTKSPSALSNRNHHSISHKHAYTDYSRVLSVTDNDYNRNENDSDNSVTMNANARNNSVRQTHSNLKVLKTRKKWWFMREICVKTKPSGAGMRDYAQMVSTLRQCANATQKQTHYKHTKIMCICSALIYKEKTMSNKVYESSALTN